MSDYEKTTAEEFTKIGEVESSEILSNPDKTVFRVSVDCMDTGEGEQDCKEYGLGYGVQMIDARPFQGNWDATYEGSPNAIAELMENHWPGQGKSGVLGLL